MRQWTEQYWGRLFATLCVFFLSTEALLGVMILDGTVIFIDNLDEFPDDVFYIGVLDASPDKWTRLQTGVPFQSIPLNQYFLYAVPTKLAEGTEVGRWREIKENGILRVEGLQTSVGWTPDKAKPANEFHYRLAFVDGQFQLHDATPTNTWGWRRQSMAFLGGAALLLLIFVALVAFRNRSC